MYVELMADCVFPCSSGSVRSSLVVIEQLDAFSIIPVSERVSVRDVQPLVLGQRKVTWRCSGK